MEKLNIELLQKVRDKIASTPEAYDQSVVGRAANSAPCGTAACIAGWACFLSGETSIPILQSCNYNTAGVLLDAARDRLGLSQDDADTLFTGDPGLSKEYYDDYDDDDIEAAWPEPFCFDWENATTNADRAKVAVAYLDSIIATESVT